MTIDELREIADSGSLEAKLVCYLLFSNGWGVERSIEVAWEHLQAPLRSENPFAQFCAGHYFASRQNPLQDLPAAVSWLERSADNGFPPAQHLLAVHLQFGLGSPVNKEAAFKLERCAAESGFVPAQLGVAAMYEQGEGTEPSAECAYAWYLQAATLGHPQAAFFVATKLQNGLGVSKDERSAIEWYRKSADAGFWEAHYFLARIYRFGLLGERVNRELADLHEDQGKLLFDKFSSAIYQDQIEGEMNGNSTP